MTSPPPSGQPQQGYSRPSNPPEGYAQQGYGAGYPPPYPQQGYGAGYPPPYPQQGDGRPGDPWAGFAPPDGASEGYAEPGNRPDYPPRYPAPYPEQSQPWQYGPRFDPGGPATGMPQPVRPPTVTAALGAFLGVLLIDIITTIMMFTSGYVDDVTAAMSTTLSGYDTSSLDTGAIVTVTIVTSLVISAFVYLFFGWKMATGRNWSRIVLTVIGALLVLGSVGGPPADTLTEMPVAEPSGYAALSVVAMILTVVGIVAMYLKQSGAFFTASRLARTGGR